MENEKEHIRRYNTIGWIVMIAGILIFVCGSIYVFYNKSHDRLNSMTNVAQIVATLISIGGLFFVLDNLVLQRITLQKQQISIGQQQTALEIQREDLKLQHEELKTSNEYFKQQNEAFLKQQYETTFFKLIENHSKLVSSQVFPFGNGYDGIDKWYRSITANVRLYKRYAMTTKVKNLEIASEYPSYVIEKHEDVFILLLNSTNHLVKLVSDKLHDEIFYHQTIYNSLSNAEKYLLGYYCFNSTTKPVNLFKLDNFNYLDLYETSKYYFPVEKDYYFPIVSIKVLNTKFYQEKKFKIINDDYDTSVFDFSFSVLRSRVNQSINLQSISCICNRSNSDKFFREDTAYEFNDLDGQVLNLTGLVGGIILKDFFSIVEKNNKHNAHNVYEFKLTFNTIFNGRGLGFEKSFNLQCGWDVNSEQISLSMSEKNSHEISVFDR